MGKKTSSTQLAVIGGGPGGYAAAFSAADLGLDVTLIDLEANPGGTCLFRGCIPSKALLHAARILTEAKEAEHWGITFPEPKIDIARLRAATEGVVAKMTGGLGQLCKARKIRLVQGRASFRDSTDVSINHLDGSIETLAFENAIIATGSRPAMLPKLMLESPRVMNSTDALKLDDVPETMLVIGGGYIGLELTTVYAALGTKVIVVELAPNLLPGADADLVKPVAKRMEEMCEAVYLESSVDGLEEVKNGIQATLKGKKIKDSKQTFDKVLMCVGRKPNSSGIRLDCTKVETDEQGFIVVDDQMRTADPGIFAIGDVAGEPMLAHKATHEGHVAAEVIAGHPVAFNAQAIPAVVFTDPEVAWVGLTQTETKAQGLNVNVATFPWGASGRATTLNRNDGLTKIITDAETERILGVGITGTNAGDLIAEAALAIEMGATAQDLHLTIHPHPTLSETIMEAAEMIYGKSTHIYKPKRKKK